MPALTNSRLGSSRITDALGTLGVARLDEMIEEASADLVGLHLFSLTWQPSGFSPPVTQVTRTGMRSKPPVG